MNIYVKIYENEKRQIQVPNVNIHYVNLQAKIE